MGFFSNRPPQTVENAQDGFKQFELGDNRAYIKLVKETVSKNGKAMLVITFEKLDRATIKYHIVDDEYSNGKLKNVHMAFGIPFANQNIDDWPDICRAGIVVCKESKNLNKDGKPFIEVSFVLPYKGKDKQTEQSDQPDNSEAQTSSSDGFADDIPF